MTQETIHSMDARSQTNGDDGIPDTWILLDSQSTVSIFRNAKFLRNIRNSRTKLVVDTNGGKQVSTMIGDLKNFGPVWYNPDVNCKHPLPRRCCQTVSNHL